MDVINNNSMEAVMKMNNNVEKDIDTNFDSCTGIKGVSKLNEPFSALTSSMWPQTLEMDGGSDDENEDMDYQCDEFGFRVPLDHLDDKNEIIEKESHRLQWLAHLEFTYSKSLEGELSWDDIEMTIIPSGKLKLMIREEGIPHSLRPQLWMRLSGALAKRQSQLKNTKAGTAICYKDIVAATVADHNMCSKNIEKDLVRTLPNNACFSNASSTGIPRLRRILRGIAWLYTDIGYCQGMGVVVSHLLLLLEEEDAFWQMCVFLEDMLPACYYSADLSGVRADQLVLRELIARYLPNIHEVLEQHDIEISLITLHWFLTVFAGIVNIRHLLRLWDIFFSEGSSFIFKIILGVLKLKEKELMNQSNTAQIFNVLSKMMSEIDDINVVIKTAYEIAGNLDVTELSELRKKSLAEIMSEEGHFVDPKYNLPKQRINKRQLTRSRSLISQLLWRNSSHQNTNNNLTNPNSNISTPSFAGMAKSLSSSTVSLGHLHDSNDAVKIKNVRQTEMLVDLRNAILQLVRHFENDESDDGTGERRYCTQPDYSLSSHAEDLERYVQVSRDRHHRAKALLDFERREDDELGFRKGDVITVVSERDEHCWIGELNGQKGWFPAKFVELLDERSKFYSRAGDDGVCERVADLVRGVLCPAIKSVLEHGIKKAHILDSRCHPWLFIEEAASREVEKDFHSVYSRLMLCKTFRLDEDGKVLTPEELLFKAIQSVNCSHDEAHAQMDVKLRSLICCGLNEQVLHLWLETLCSSTEIVKKWYHPWSFIRSPGWVQIKCELRLLCQLSFTLSRDFEINKRNLTNYNARNLFLSQTNHKIDRLKFNGDSSIAMETDVNNNNHVNGYHDDDIMFNANNTTNSTNQLFKKPNFYTSNNNKQKTLSPFNDNDDFSVHRNVSDMLVKHHLFSWEIN